ncbi:MAG TPA: hypothetical protein VG454_11080 [Gemmatimonadales bacterium]|nr:hypothetical protein [Gemmatimonadales bacterium]
MKPACLALLALLAAAGSGGCAYYNAMWSAEQYAKAARKAEARGQEAEARSQWALAAAKADAVVVKHPKSRWVDDALVLEAEGYARSGACPEATDIIPRARAVAKDVALRERLALAEAQCALAAGHPVQADAALEGVLTSKDHGRRSRAEYFAGQAAVLQLDYDAAVVHLRRSREPAARPLRAHALLALGAGHAVEAAAAIDSIGGDPAFETDRADLLVELSTVGGPAMASATLDRLIAQSRIPFAEQARLLIADGDRLAGAGDYQAAEARYRRAIDMAGAGSAEAGTARVRVQRLVIAQARQSGDLAPVIDALSNLSRAETGNTEAKHLLELLNLTVTSPPSAGARFRIAEVVRDSLAAPALAGQLFLDVAATDTASLYAPKALVAAIPLLPDRHDSIAAILDTRYPESPYTRAYHGEASVTYAAAEDSLARELGVAVATAAVVRAPATRFAIPIPGMRGPRLDEPAPQLAGEGPKGEEKTPARPGARPGNAKTTRDRPALPERP